MVGALREFVRALASVPFYEEVMSALRNSDFEGLEDIKLEIRQRLLPADGTPYSYFLDPWYWDFKVDPTQPAEQRYFRLGVIVQRMRAQEDIVSDQGKSIKDILVADSVMFGIHENQDGPFEEDPW